MRCGGYILCAPYHSWTLIRAYVLRGVVTYLVVRGGLCVDGYLLHECFKCGWPDQSDPFSHRNMKIVAVLVVTVPDSVGIIVIYLLFVVTLIHLDICK